MNQQHYFDGQWVPEEKLLISARDLSVVRGFGVFDFLRTYNGKPFCLAEHVARFYRSAAFLGLEIPMNEAELIKVVEEGIAKNDLPETGVRLTLTGGADPSDPYMITPGKPSLIITFSPASSPNPELYEKGGKVITTPYLRQLPQAKTLNYMLAVLAHSEVKRQGAVEAVYADNGQIYEGTIANLLVVKDGVVITPKDNVLIGITRNVVLKLCDNLGIEHREEDLFTKDLESYDEMFITGTTKEVMPIVQFDSHVIADGKPGPITRRLVTAFHELVEKS
jgi:branched-chain amino acid aminotransferase